MQGLAASAATAVWMCPECGHGSPEPRDERAHLDAHRQLRAFFADWDAGTATGLKAAHQRRRRHGRALLWGVVGVVLLALTATMFSRINGDPETRRTSAPGEAVSQVAAPGDAVSRVAAPQPQSPPVAESAPAPQRTGASSAPRPPEPPAVSTTPRAVPATDARAGMPSTLPQPEPAPAVVAPPMPTQPTPPPTASQPEPAPVVVAPSTPPTVAAVAPPAHLVSLCLLSICLTVL